MDKLFSSCNAITITLQYADPHLDLSLLYVWGASWLDILSTNQQKNMSTTETQRELRKAILDLPLGQLAQFAQKGINGQPLHRALGFSQDKEFKQWLLKHQDDIADSSEEEEEEAQVPAEESSSEEEEDRPSKSPAKKKEEETKRNRSAPSERSSKFPVSRNRQVVVVPRNESRDPRFTQQAINHSLIRHRYEFLEPMRDAEIVTLRKTIRKQDELAAEASAAKRRKRVKKMSEDELAERRATLTKLEQHRGDTKRARDYQSKLHELKQTTKMVSSTTKKKLKLQVRYDDLAQNEHRFKRFLDKKRKEGEFKERRKNRELGHSGGGPQLGV